MSTAYTAASGLPGGEVHVAGIHATFAGFGVGGGDHGGVHGSFAALVPGIIGDSGAGVLAFTGVGPGTLPLAIAGLASIVAGGVALVMGREKSEKRTKSRRRRRIEATLPDLSHLADALTA
jgi:hypothetical protein